MCFIYLQTSLDYKYLLGKDDPSGPHYDACRHLGDQVTAFSFPTRPKVSAAAEGGELACMYSSARLRGRLLLYYFVIYLSRLSVLCSEWLLLDFYGGP